MGDNPVQAAAAARLLDGDEPVGVSGVAIAEAAWVMERFYKVPRAVIVERLTRLIRKRNVHLLGIDESRAVAALWLCGPSRRVSFGDALIMADTVSHGLGTIYAFDRRFPSVGLEVRVPT